MNYEESVETFCGLSPEEQIKILAAYSFRLTIEARDTYEVDGDSLIDPKKMRRFNEAQHRVTSQTHALVSSDEDRYPDDVLLKIIAHPDSDLHLAAVFVHTVVTEMQARRM